MFKKYTFAASLLIATVVLLAAPQRGWAQGAVTLATITGDVFDESGAAIPDAKITVANEATGLRRETMTDLSGHFSVLQLPAGIYDIDVEKQAFKKSRIHQLMLNVGAELSLKFTLNVGEVAQQVEVGAETAAAIETTKTDVSNVIQERQVRELPLNQRSFTALVTQQPGLVVMTNTAAAAGQNPTATVFSQGSQMSANGQISSSMAYLVDGVNINNSGYGAPGTAAGGDIPGVEAIQEFKVLSHNYSAAYGGSAGAVVSFATRGGTNKLQGSLYEFLRNDLFDAQSFFDTQKNPFRRNQFGATLGGPIKRDKVFIFGNYEGLRQSLTTTDIGTVPTLCARNGGVGGTCNFPVIGPILQLDGTYQRGLVAIPPGVKALMDLYPQPNGVDFGNGIAEVTFSDSQPVRQDFGVIKVDINASAKDMIMVRHSVTDASGTNDYFLPTFQFQKSSRLQNSVVKWTRVINKDKVNTASFGFNRSVLVALVSPTVTLRPEQYTGNPARGFVGNIAVGSGARGNTSGSLSSIGNDNWGPHHGATNVFQVNDDFIYSRGNHTLALGGQIIRHQWNWKPERLIAGLYAFNTLNDLLAGNPALLIIREDNQPASLYYRTTQFAWYAEDTWRLRPNFTLTFGLRHEFQVPIISEINNRIGNYRSLQDATLSIGEPFHNYSLKQFEPRVGVAYDPFKDGKTVIRAGVGLFYSFVPIEVYNDLTLYGPQPVINTFFGEPIAPDANIFNPIPFPACPACTAPTTFHGLIDIELEPVRAPMSVQWNLQVERELPRRFKLSATYTGSQTANIIRGYEGNSNLPCGTDNGQPIYPPACPFAGTASPALGSSFFTVGVRAWDAHANYHAGTVVVSRQFAGGLMFQTSYTFAKAISESDTINNSTVLLGNASASQDPFNRHNDRSESMMSIRHRFTLNAIYELPFGKSKRFLANPSGPVQAIFGGWSINTLAEVRSGIPFSVLAGFGITGVGDSISIPDRTNILRPNAVLGGVEQYFDPKAYALQDPGHLGNAPRNSVRGPGFSTLDVGLAKQFKLTEKTGLEFRVEAYNVLNHPSFDLPFNQLYVYPASPADTDKTSCNLTPAQAATVSCNPQAGRISRTVGVPRQIQFALKLTF